MVTQAELTPAVTPVPRSRLHRLTLPALVTGALVACTAYVGMVDPNVPGHYPLCPTKYFTGFDCPGCGGLRATHALLHGDLRSAIDHNAFVVLVVIPLSVVLLVRWWIHAWRGDPPSTSPSIFEKPAVMWSLTAVMVVFTILRNVPGVPWMSWMGSSAS